MRGREHDHRHAGSRLPSRRPRARRRYADRRDSRLPCASCGWSRRSRPRRRGRRKSRARISSSAGAAMSKRRDCASDPISAADRGGVAPDRRRTAGARNSTRPGCPSRATTVGDDVAHFVGAGRERARQDVVDVGRDHEPLDRQAHAHRDIAGEDVAEISGRHREGDLAMRRAERDRGGEVVDDLRDDARPVDRVDAGEPHAVAERVVVEQALHDRLAVVERAVDRDRVDVVVRRRRHHAALHVGDAAVRKQHDEVDAARGRGTPRPRRRRCRPRSRPRWWRARRARSSAWSISRARNCIARSLKASVGPWNSSSTKRVRRRPAPAAPRPDGGRCRRPRAPCGRDRPRRSASPTNGRITSAATSAYGRPAKRGDLVAGENRPGFRHIEAAVAGEAGERHVDESRAAGLRPGSKCTARVGIPGKARNLVARARAAQGTRLGGTAGALPANR